ncbi:MAG TPA: hypothetical protein VKM94_00955 [Blastocatellia bacterium]|nr:hypothetical protein [Blastocatellia bacterium]
MIKNKLVRFLSLLIVIGMLVISASTAEGMIHHHHRRHNPEAGKGKAAKRIGIGAAIGAGAGGLIGGRKGALIGAGAGAGGGALYHIHKKRSWRRHHRY